MCSSHAERRSAASSKAHSFARCKARPPAYLVVREHATNTHGPIHEGRIAPADAVAGNRARAPPLTRRRAARRRHRAAAWQRTGAEHLTTGGTAAAASATGLCGRSAPCALAGVRDRRFLSPRAPRPGAGARACTAILARRAARSRSRAPDPFLVRRVGCVRERAAWQILHPTSRLRSTRVLGLGTAANNDAYACGEAAEPSHPRKGIDLASRASLGHPWGHVGAIERRRAEHEPIKINGGGLPTLPPENTLATAARKIIVPRQTL